MPKIYNLEQWCFCTFPFWFDLHRYQKFVSLPNMPMAPFSPMKPHVRKKIGDSPRQPPFGCRRRFVTWSLWKRWNWGTRMMRCFIEWFPSRGRGHCWAFWQDPWLIVRVIMAKQWNWQQFPFFGRIIILQRSRKKDFDTGRCVVIFSIMPIRGGKRNIHYLRLVMWGFATMRHTGTFHAILSLYDSPRKGIDSFFYTTSFETAWHRNRSK